MSDMSDKVDESKTLPAFPVHDEHLYEGMTLRDYFAAAALTGLWAHGGISGVHGHDAQVCYEIADEMLKEKYK